MRNGGIDVALYSIANRDLVQCLEVTGPQRQGLVVGGKRLGDGIAAEQRVAATKPGRRQSRIDRKRLLEGGKRFVEPFQLNQCESAIAERVGVIRLDGDRALAACKGFVVAPELR